MPISNSSPPRNPDLPPPERLEGPGGSNVRYRGRLLYPERGPVAFAERLARSALLDAEPDRLYILASPGLWHGVAGFLSALGEGSFAVALEADPGLAALSQAALPPEIAADPRLAWCPGAGVEALLARARERGAFRRAVLVRLSGGAAFHEAFYQDLAARVDAELVAEWKNRASLIFLSRRWIGNIFSNLANLEEIAPLPFPKTPRPILVAGAGPSLEASLALMAELREGLFILACDTALPCLHDAGIQADLAVCLEAQAHNLPDFLGSSEGGIALAADLSSHPSSFRALSGDKHLSMVRITEGPFMERLASLGLPVLPMPPLGSVGVHAVHIALKLGSAPLLLTGLDFAHPAGKTHARGAPALRAEAQRMTRLYRWNRQVGAAFRHGIRSLAAGLPEGNAAPWLSDPVLGNYAALLERENLASGRRIFDLRGSGLPIGAEPLGIPAARRLIEAARGQAAPDQARAPALARGETGEAHRRADIGALGRLFLERELSALKRLERGFKGREVFGRDGLIAAVRDLDYLLWPLPDAWRLKDLPQDLLNRILVETEFWIMRLSELAGG